MSNKPNYFKIGVFVVLSIILIIGAIVVFSAGIFTKQKIYFETYFNESVSGLNVGAAVKDRGVKVGQVERIAFVSDEYNMPRDSHFSKYERYVMVVGSIEKPGITLLGRAQLEKRLKRAINAGMRVRLSSELLTGLATLEADYLDPNRFGVMPIGWRPKNYYIPSSPGQFTTLKDSVDKILFKLEKVDIDRISKKIEDTITSVQQAVKDAAVGKVSDQVNGLLAEARQSNRQIQQILSSPKIDANNSNVALVLANLNTTLTRVDSVIEAQSGQLSTTLDSMRQVLQNLNDVTENLKANPSNVIFSKEPPQSEVYK
ncbi:MAG: hypothetical protein A2Y07_08680 [Planctomycetes bacterium GWF2_50_10]|nr:MAG: hypothetical protein A2Y07_08680 [Planctomycetes bacterium GWF2_50_10]